MKKISFIALFLCYCCWHAAGQDYWQQVSSGTHKNLLCVSFGNSSTGYIGGTDSTLLKTTDGGKTWTALHHTGILYEPYTVDIIDLQFVDANTGYAILSNKSRPDLNGKLYKTKDGGHTWTVPATMWTSGYRVFFFDDDNGYMTGVAPFAGATINKLSHGVWGPVRYLGAGTSYLASAIDFLNTSTGIVGGTTGYVYRTFDAGATWDTIKTNIDTTINALLYLNENTIIGMTGNVGAIIRSDDKGATWSFDISSGTFFYPEMKAATLSGKDSLIIVGQSITTGKGIIYYFDPADPWMNIATAGQWLNDVTMRDSAVAFIAGDSGLILTNMLSVLSISAKGSMPEGFRVYPNPGTGIFHTAAPAAHQLQVYDMAGKLVFREDRRETRHQIDLSALPKGNYLIKLLSGDNTTGTTTISLQ